MNRKGTLFVVTGPSGAGKGTVLKEVTSRMDHLYFSVSATTRPPRPGERDGVDYYFITEEKFGEMVRQGAFVEYDCHAKACYGTPEQQLKEKMECSHVLLDIEPNGAFAVRAKRPDATLIFIMPPSAEILEQRLRSRGDTSEDQIRLRLERAKWEMEQRFRYDYVVTNDRADACADQILNIIARVAGNEESEE